MIITVEHPEEIGMDDCLRVVAKIAGTAGEIGLEVTYLELDPAAIEKTEERIDLESIQL